MKLYIGVIGTGERKEPYYSLAYEVGRLVAKNGAVLVCGGLGGVMEAAARGASEAGGVSIGILPGISRAEANQYITYAIPTGMGEMRNALIVRTSDVLIAVGGGSGTLSEIALAVKTGKPVIGLKTWQAKNEESELPLMTAGDPEEAVKKALTISGK